MKTIYTLLLSLPIIFAVDLAWLGLFAKDFYQKNMSPLVTIEFNWIFVVIFYAVYLVGVYLFAIKPGIDAESLQKTLVSAALFGFFCYATYDLTNLATVKNWPLHLAIVDMFWGTFLTTFTAFVAYKIFFWLPQSMTFFSIGLCIIGFSSLLGFYLKRNDIADVLWGVGIFCFSFTGYILGGKGVTTSIVIVLIFLWAVRISTHIGLRFISKRQEDQRYTIWRNTWKYFYTRSFFQVYVLQTLLMALVASPLIITSALSPVENYLFIAVGALIALFGLFFETRADLALKNFLKNPGNRGAILTTDVWKYSRHPNYFGEVTFWWGICIIFLPSLHILYFISPVTITILILFVSGIPMLEKKYADNTEWQAYAAQTPALIPSFMNLKYLLQTYAKN